MHPRLLCRAPCDCRAQPAGLSAAQAFCHELSRRQLHLSHPMRRHAAPRQAANGSAPRMALPRRNTSP
eukprot:4322250-Prymnesium_polylepis.1